MLQVNFSQKSHTQGSLVLFCFEQNKFSDEALKFNESHQGILSHVIKKNKYSGKKNEVLSFIPPRDLNYSHIILVGLGKLEKITCEIIQNAAGNLIASQDSTLEESLEIQLGSLTAPSLTTAEIAAQFAFGAQLRYWRFDKYRTKEDIYKKPSLKSIHFILENSESAQKKYHFLEQMAEGIFLTRSLVTEPSNVLYPESYVARLQDLKQWNVSIEVLHQRDLQQLGMNALLGVAQGSCKEPKVVILRWNGGPSDQQPLAFVGKGVTFDSGGISIKPSLNMGDMKYDMAGSAVVAGLIRTLAGREAKVNAVGILGLVENMPSGTAQRPGDVVKSLSGQTIEVADTDAEGRLVLADLLWYTQDRFKPKLMIDLATLTGAISIALGEHYAGLFSFDDQLCEHLVQAGEISGERLWRLPLGEKYDQEINSDIADVRNLGPRGKGGSITAAQFLSRFVNKTPWAHLDIAGVTWADKNLPTAEKGATAFGVRLLNQFIQNFYER